MPATAERDAYFDAIQLPTTIRDRVNVLLAYGPQLIGHEPTNFFVESTMQDDKSIIFHNLTLFFENIYIDMTIPEPGFQVSVANLNRIEVFAYHVIRNFDFKTHQADSILNAVFRGGNLHFSLNAAGANCSYLAQVVKTALFPYIKGAPIQHN